MSYAVEETVGRTWLALLQGLLEGDASSGAAAARSGESKRMVSLKRVANSKLVAPNAPVITEALKADVVPATQMHHFSTSKPSDYSIPAIVLQPPSK